MASRSPETVVLHVVPGPLAEKLVARAAGAVAAQCDLPIDRLEDAVLVLECLLEGRPADGDVLTVELEGLPGVIAVKVGPYAAGEAQRLIAICGLGDAPLLATLSGDVASDGQYVTLVVAAMRPGPGRLL